MKLTIEEILEDVNNRLRSLEERSERDSDFILKHNENHHEMILLMRKEISNLNNRMSREVNTLSDRLYAVFYKVFPEADESDMTLERIVREHRKNKPPSEL